MSRSVTLAGYACLGVAAVAYQLAGTVRRRTPTLGDALRLLTRSLLGRLLLLGGWMWLGWHLFVRSRWR
jgi:hypothetical protein